MATSKSKERVNKSSFEGFLFKPATQTVKYAKGKGAVRRLLSMDSEAIFDLTMENKT